jgi:hypothetical protein
LRDLLSISFVAFLLATNKLTIIVTMRQYLVVENIGKVCWKRGSSCHLVQLEAGLNVRLIYVPSVCV